MTAIQWRAAEEHAQKTWADERERRLLRQTKVLHDKGVRAAEEDRRKRAAMNSGEGWRMLTYPRLSHAELDDRARGIWARVWHSIDWPEGWRVRWGELDDTLARPRLGQCAAAASGVVLGLAVMHQQLILVDEVNQRNRTRRDFDTTLIHELIHANQRNESHGPRFQAALKSATAYYFGDGAELVAAALPGRPARTSSAFPSGGWEYRG